MAKSNFQDIAPVVAKKLSRHCSFGGQIEQSRRGSIGQVKPSRHYGSAKLW